MKNIPHIQIAHRRNDAELRTTRLGRNFPAIDHQYQSVTLRGSCGTPARFKGEPSFFEISNHYFAHEAPRSFAVDSGVFAALILAALLPIVNGFEAIATLIHQAGVL